jgi:uncharacterized membrane protein
MGDESRASGPAHGRPACAEPEYLTVTSGLPQIRSIGTDAPRRWLVKGWSDFKAGRSASLFYGLVLTLMGVILTQAWNTGAVELAFLTGFLLVGPFLLMGLYDISRRVERGDAPRLADTMAAWKANAPAIGFFAVILALLFGVWVRVSLVVVALFFPNGVPSGPDLAAHLAESPEPIAFIVAYFAAGFGFALFVFATSVVSLPMLLDRDKTDALSAMITSFNALRLNFRPMLLWAFLIVVLVAAGFATAYLGLLVVLPWIGHATWHAYKEVVE